MSKYNFSEARVTAVYNQRTNSRSIISSVIARNTNRVHAQMIKARERLRQSKEVRVKPNSTP